MSLLQKQITNSSSKLLGLTIVVPCFNEEEGLDQLSERLKTLHSVFSDRLDLEVVFVDDGSRDKTFEGLQNRFQQFDWVRILKLDQNRGITAAILTGIRAATNELVASIDADCTYDPIQIMSFVELMDDDIAMVTASPYHPRGSVEGVPSWRLALSRSASSCYGVLLGTSLHTYTSCFRLYRRSWMQDLPVRENGFVGVAEVLWQLHVQGAKIVEAPARLTSRKVGFSKMRTFPVIVSHLKLMTRILLHRLTQSNPEGKKHKP